MTEKDWEAEALLWERRVAALRGVVDLALEAAYFAARTSTDQVGVAVRMKHVLDALNDMVSEEDLAGTVGRAEVYARLREAGKKRFAEVAAAFDAEMRRRGSTATLENVLGAIPRRETPAPRLPPWTEEESEQLVDFFSEIYEQTAEENPNAVLLRALGVYRSFVVHARGGGQVKFVKEGAPDRVLKVRLR